MTKQKLPNWATIVAIIAMILVVGYFIFASQDHIYSSCDELDMNLLQAYDADRSGFIRGIEFMAANDDQTAGIITQDQLNQVEYAWTHACPVIY